MPHGRSIRGKLLTPGVVLEEEGEGVCLTCPGGPQHVHSQLSDARRFGLRIAICWQHSLCLSAADCHPQRASSGAGGNALFAQGGRGRRPR